MRERWYDEEPPRNASAAKGWAAVGCGTILVGWMVSQILKYPPKKVISPAEKRKQELIAAFQAGQAAAFKTMAQVSDN